MGIILEQVPLKRYSTFDIGGPARFLVSVSSNKELEEALLFADQKKCPVLCIGRGSNCLFHDSGFFGLVIVNALSSLQAKEAGIWDVGSGFSFAQLGRLTAKEGYSGLEFAAGIPASFGGAIYMNAGASGQETKDILVDVTTMSLDGQVHTYEANTLSFGYRTSPFQQKKEIILSARIRLMPSPIAYGILKEKVEYRMKTQPYSDKSIGCFFRNPPGTSAGKLIEQAGMKGYSIGGASVSALHANFIVNRGGATAEDVCQLALAIEQKVRDSFGVSLESEAKIIDPYGHSLSLLKGSI
jgi:UDP-N-acetylmuramate dehydrogenase